MTECNEGNRICIVRHWCNELTTNAKGEVWACSRKPGHDGPHVACLETSEDQADHNRSVWGSDAADAEMADRKAQDAQDQRAETLDDSDPTPSEVVR